MLPPQPGIHGDTFHSVSVPLADRLKMHVFRMRGTPWCMNDRRRHHGTDARERREARGTPWYMIDSRRATRMEDALRGRGAAGGGGGIRQYADAR